MAKRVTAALVVVSLMLVVAACGRDRKPKVGSQATVTNSGGSYRLDGLTVVAEPDTVTQSTTLTMRFAGTQRPTGLLDGLNAPAVLFDLSLAANTQPAKPLRVDIPLTGRFLPVGAQPADAVLYSRTADGKGFVVTPSEVDDQGVLHAEMDHLSDKAVLYLSQAELDKMIASGALSVLPAADCAQTLSAESADLRVVGGDPDKRLTACLEMVGTKPMVTIKNNTGYLWSVASSQGANAVQQTVDGYDEEAVKAISAAIFPRWGTTFVSGGSYARVVPDLTALPVRITTRADQVVASSEAIWEAFKFLVGFYAGITKGDDVLAYAKLLITDAAAIDACLRTVLGKGSSGARLVLDLITDCGVPIGEFILKRIGEPLAKATRIHQALLRRVQAAGSGIAAAFSNLGTRIEGLFQQVKGNEITFSVTAAKCISRSQANANVTRFVQEVGVTDLPVAALRNDARIDCRDGWAVVHDIGVYHSADARSSDYPSWFGPLLVRWKGNRWAAVYANLSPFDCGTDECQARGTRNRTECRQAPENLRTLAQC